MPKFSWLTCLSLTFSLFVAPLAGAVAPANHTLTQRVADARESLELKALSQYGTDLTELAKMGKLQIVAGYDSQIERAIKTLARSAKNNPVLLGEAGTNRGVVVEGIARKIADGDVPANLLNRRVFNLDIEALFADAQGQTEVNNRLAQVLAEVKSAKGEAILFIDGLDELATQDEAGSASFLNMLEAALARNEARIIGAATPASFDLKLASREGLKGKLQGILIDENSDLAEADDDDETNETSETAENNSEAFVGDKVAPDLRELIQNSSANSSGNVSVILQGEALKSPAMRKFFKQNGIRITNEFANLNAQAIEMPAHLVEQLANFDQVSYLSTDGEMTSLDDDDDDGHVRETTGADDVDEIEEDKPDGSKYIVKVNGSGIGIAILDSGIYTSHKAFLNREGTKSRVVFSKDFTGEARTDDPYGHGTHVASLAAGNGQIANGAYAGVAPDANIINLRVLNSQGTGKTSALLNALNWILVNRATFNIRVANLSIGSVAVNSYKNDPICRAVRSLANAGVVVVAAAGNEGKTSTGRKVYGQIHAPGNEPSAITVGAVNTLGTNSRADDGVATYSSRGPTRSYWTDASGIKHYDNLIKPEIVAPGNKLVGAESTNNVLVRLLPFLDCKVSTVPTSQMMTLSGTSMAAPIVAGTAALLLQTNPKLTPNMIKALIMYTAQPLRGYNMFEQGAGQINVSGAMTLSRLIRADLSATTPLGTPLFTKSPPTGVTIGYSTITGYTFRWSQGIILNRTYATGNELGLYQKIYAQGVLLGDAEAISNGVLVGDTTKVTRGVLLGDTIMTSSGGSLNQGSAFIGTGVLIGDGVLLGDGVLIGDGVLLGDGVLIGDGVLVGDNISLTSTPMLYGDNTPAMAIVKDTGVSNFNY